MARVVTICSDVDTQLSWTAPSDGVITAATVIGSAMMISVIRGDSISSLLDNPGTSADERFRLYLFPTIATGNGYFPNLNLEVVEGEQLQFNQSDGTNFPQLQFLFEPNKPI